MVFWGYSGPCYILFCFVDSMHPPSIGKAPNVSAERIIADPKKRLNFIEIHNCIHIINYVNLYQDSPLLTDQERAKWFGLIPCCKNSSALLSADARYSKNEPLKAGSTAWPSGALLIFLFSFGASVCLGFSRFQ